MATGVKIKTTANGFVDIHKPYIKTGAATWSEGVKIYHKKSSDKWQLVWEAGDAVVEINITSNRTDFNVYNHLVGLGLDPASQPYNVVINVSNGAVLGASSTASYGLATGALKPGSKLTLNIAAGCYISGAGGAGGWGCKAGPQSVCTGTTGGSGGSAIYLQCSVLIDNYGRIQSGGNGGKGGNVTKNKTNSGYYGSGGGGGGGGGSYPGSGGTSTYGDAGLSGTLTDGGKGGAGGMNESTSNIEVTAGSYGAAPGSAASIKSNGNTITWLNQGTILGSIT